MPIGSGSSSGAIRAHGMTVGRRDDLVPQSDPCESEQELTAGLCGMPGSKPSEGQAAACQGQVADDAQLFGGGHFGISGELERERLGMRVRDQRIGRPGQ